jgi:hypothetical protein
VCSIIRQSGHFGDFIDRGERGVLFGAREIRQEILDPDLAPLVGAALLLVGRLDLTIKIAYVD